MKVPREYWSRNFEAGHPVVRLSVLRMLPADFASGVGDEVLFDRTKVRVHNGVDQEIAVDASGSWFCLRGGTMHELRFDGQVTRRSKRRVLVCPEGHATRVYLLPGSPQGQEGQK